jgi:uridine phosphorylase
LALIEACSGQSINYHVGIGVTVDSFYATKPHLISEKSIPSLLEPELTVWEKSGALHMEMENAVVFVLSSLLGIRAGSICTVGSNLLLGERPDKAPSDRPAMEAACLAALILKKWDKPAESGNRSFSPRPMS